MTSNKPPASPTEPSRPPSYNHSIIEVSYVARSKGRPARRSKKRPAGKKPEKQPLRSAIYCRVSTDEQAREGVSLESQERICKHYMSIREEDPRQDRPWELARVYSDAGYSGKDFERPQIRRLMADIDRSEIDMVVTYKIDRVARSIRHFYDFWEKLEAAGAEVVRFIFRMFDAGRVGRLQVRDWQGRTWSSPRRGPWTIQREAPILSNRGVHFCDHIGGDSWELLGNPVDFGRAVSVCVD